MSHDEQNTNKVGMIPFVLVILGTAFLILVSDLAHPSEKTEETKTETPAH